MMLANRHPNYEYTRENGNIIYVWFKYYMPQVDIGWMDHENSHIMYAVIGPDVIETQADEDEIFAILHELYEQIPDEMEKGFAEPMLRYIRRLSDEKDGIDETIERVSEILHRASAI